MTTNNDLQVVAKILKVLGHEMRLAIYRRMIRSGFKGLPVGDLQQIFNVPSSTLSHHISKMLAVGLIEQRREATTLYCVVKCNTLTKVMVFLQEECCADEN